MSRVECEEIVINEYLKGNISNQFKDYMLFVMNETGTGIQS